MWFSPASGENLKNSAPFASVALAGHVAGGGRYCDCNNPESCTGGLNVRISDSKLPYDGTTRDNLNIELGIAFMALALWLKLRA
jgi:hypothetical protein